MSGAALFRVESNRASLVLREAGGARLTAVCEGEAPRGRLAVRALRADVALRIVALGDDGAVLEIDGDRTDGPRLFEHAIYGVYARSKSPAAIEVTHDDPVAVAQLDAEDGGRVVHGRVAFGSHPGRSRFVVKVGGEPEFDVEVDVFPSRLDYATDFAAMLDEVEDAARGLALQSQRANWHADVATDERSARNVSWLAHLESVIASLETATARVAQRPLESLVRDEHALVRAERVRHADASTRAALRRSVPDRARVHDRLPDRVARADADTPEHRWIATQLAATRSRIDTLAARERARTTGVRRDATVRTLASISTRIATMERNPPFSATRNARPPAGFASSRLLAAPGYAECHAILTALSRALTVDGQALRVGLKDTFALYETWCFLAVLRAVARATGCAIEPRSLIDVREDGLQLRLGRGSACAVVFDAPGGRTVTVTYNPRLEHPASARAQQPDILIALDAPGWPTLLVVLDAKYRVDASPATVARHGLAAPPDDALDAMHRYRDAVYVGTPAAHPVLAAVALYPLRADDRFEHSRLHRALQLGGVGAVPALPGATASLDRWIHSVVARGAISLAHRAVGSAAVARLHAFERLALVRVPVADPVLGWTSALAIERARTAAERWLVTACEWQLYEDALATGIDVHLEPVPAGEPGRVWLVVGTRRARYVGERLFAFVDGTDARTIDLDAARAELIA